jgi:putative endonuclease
MNPCFVYILYSQVHDKYYVGQTNDITDRLSRHNAGTEKATKPYKPWQMIWFTTKPTRAEAMALETKLKNLSKERLRQFIQKYSGTVAGDDEA